MRLPSRGSRVQLAPEHEQSDRPSPFRRRARPRVHNLITARARRRATGALATFALVVGALFILLPQGVDRRDRVPAPG